MYEPRILTRSILVIIAKWHKMIAQFWGCSRWPHRRIQFRLEPLKVLSGIDSSTQRHNLWGQPAAMFDPVKPRTELNHRPPWNVFGLFEQDFDYCSCAQHECKSGKPPPTIIQDQTLCNKCVPHYEETWLKLWNSQWLSREWEHAPPRTANNKYCTTWMFDKVVIIAEQPIFHLRNNKSIHTIEPVWGFLDYFGKPSCLTSLIQATAKK